MKEESTWEVHCTSYCEEWAVTNIPDALIAMFLNAPEMLALIKDFVDEGIGPGSLMDRAEELVKRIVR